MDTQTKARVTKDVANKKITVVKDLDVDIKKVWTAYTDRKMLDQWWVSKPWRAETRELNFKEGGHWLYSMNGPNNERQWAKMDFQKIDAPNQFTAIDCFTDEKGTKDKNMPSIHWSNSFEKKGDGTRLRVELIFDREEDMKKILDTGFEQGFQMGLENLDELLAK
ncbi:MAG TPA: SRPBCC domain-containing protein [Chitinophagaceae bacterium]|nr:SRPBCC domain-containing protein [Chitinophagaceae bacterium]